LKKGKWILIFCFIFLVFLGQVAHAEDNGDFRFFQRLNLFERDSSGHLGPMDLRGDQTWGNGVYLEAQLRVDEIAERITRVARFKTHEGRPGKPGKAECHFYSWILSERKEGEKPIKF